MKSVIIAIHGLGNKPKRRLLKKWWKKALREGLEREGIRIRLLPFRLVYWADILHEKPLRDIPGGEDDPLHLREPYIAGGGEETPGPNRLRSLMFRALDKGLDKVFLGRNNEVKFEAAADKFIKSFFPDLGAYYSPGGKEVQKAIQERLRVRLKRCRRKRILLIAHSMGSIVAVDVLNRCSSDLHADTLVTIGSPLGLPNIKAVVLKSQEEHKTGSGRPQTPEAVRKDWYNLSDTEDAVAMDQSLADDYEANSRGVRVQDKKVFNNYICAGNRNPHKSYGYLRTPEMAAIVADFFRNAK